MLALNPTLRSGSKSVDFDRIETRGVLAGAYRGRRRSPEQELTHLVFIRAGDSFGFATGCRQPLDNMVDPYGHTAAQKRERPTCPTCAAKYDRIVQKYGSVILGSIEHASNPVRRRWFRGGMPKVGRPMWYAASLAYAEFYAAQSYGAQSSSEQEVVELNLAASENILDLSEMGARYDEEIVDRLGLPTLRVPSGDTYDWAERAQSKLAALGYTGVVVYQWHDDYSDNEQLTLLFWGQPG